MAKLGIALGSGPRGLGFESRYSDQETGIRFRGFRFLNWVERGFEQSNATVQWTVACRRLDGGNTLILIPKESECSESRYSDQKCGNRFCGSHIFNPCRGSKGRPAQSAGKKHAGGMFFRGNHTPIRFIRVFFVQLTTELSLFDTRKAGG